VTVTGEYKLPTSHQVARSHPGNVFNSTNFRHLAYQLQQVNTLPSPVLTPAMRDSGTHTTAGFEFERVRYIESLG